MIRKEKVCLQRNSKGITYSADLFFFFPTSNLFHSCGGNTLQMSRRHLHSTQAALPEVGIGTRGTVQGEKIQIWVRCHEEV